MKKFLATTAISIGLLPGFVFGTAVPGAFVDIGIAKASSYGGAYVSIADDASSVFYNPAGITTSEYKDVTFMYAKQKGIVPYNYFAFIWPFNKFRGAGFGVMMSGDSVLFEQTYIFSYSENLDWMLFNFTDGLYAGVNAKIHTASFGNNDDDPDPLKVKGNAWGFGMDFSLLWRFTRDVQGGFMIRDAISAVVWKADTSTTAGTESVPYTTAMGLRYKIKDFMASFQIDDFDKLRVGAEFTFFTYIDLRGGFTMELDYESYKEYMLGLGIGKFEFGAKREFSMNIDAAYVFERFDNTLKIQTSFKFR